MKPNRFSSYACWYTVFAVLICLKCQFALAQGDENLLFFTNDGCAPCKLVAPAIAELQAEGFPVKTINVSQHPDWADAYKVSSTPAIYLTRGNRVLDYKFGVLRKTEILQRLANAGIRPRAQRATANPIRRPPTEPRPRQTKVSLASKQPRPLLDYRSSTLHKGTTSPANSAENVAMSSTVRLKVEDELGYSYATGTVIHRHAGESLVVTCGHVFRESKGRGKITAEFGFEHGAAVEVPGRLLDYDSDANDIALVEISSGQYELGVSRLAKANTKIKRGEEVFSIGCDRGDNPTIRRTAIKNIAWYDESLKYDIFGRPVNGRSGGGLFNRSGELVGVCNAAAVEVDEGIYSALETIHWQVNRANLAHLFRDPPRGQLAAAPSRRELPRMVDLRRGRDAAVSRAALDSNPKSGVGGVRQAGFSGQDTSDSEVMIVVRSRSNPASNKVINISDPTPRLLDYLESMDDDVRPTMRSFNVATHREPIHRVRK